MAYGLQHLREGLEAAQRPVDRVGAQRRVPAIRRDRERVPLRGVGAQRLVRRGDGDGQAAEGAEQEEADRPAGKRRRPGRRGGMRNRSNIENKKRRQALGVTKPPSLSLDDLHAREKRGSSNCC